MGAGADVQIRCTKLEEKSPAPTALWSLSPEGSQPGMNSSVAFVLNPGAQPAMNGASATVGTPTAQPGMNGTSAATGTPAAQPEVHNAALIAGASVVQPSMNSPAAMDGAAAAQLGESTAARLAGVLRTQPGMHGSAASPCPPIVQSFAVSSPDAGLPQPGLVTVLASHWPARAAEPQVSSLAMLRLSDDATPVQRPLQPASHVVCAAAQLNPVHRGCRAYG